MNVLRNQWIALKHVTMMLIASVNATVWMFSVTTVIYFQALKPEFLFIQFKIARVVKTAQVVVINAPVVFANVKTSISTAIGMNALMTIALFLDVVSMRAMKIIYVKPNA